MSGKNDERGTRSEILEPVVIARSDKHEESGRAIRGQRRAEQTAPHAERRRSEKGCDGITVTPQRVTVLVSKSRYT